MAVWFSLSPSVPRGARTALHGVAPVHARVGVLVVGVEDEHDVGVTGGVPEGFQEPLALLPASPGGDHDQQVAAAQRASSACPAHKPHGVGQRFPVPLTRGPPPKEPVAPASSA